MLQKAVDIHRTSTFGQSPARDHSLLATWGHICELYSNCQLSNIEDRLIAFAGVAETFAASSGGTYLAGLFETGIEYQLLWKTIHPALTKVNEPPGAPSWSWLHIDGQVEFHFGNEEQLLIKFLSATQHSQEVSSFFGSKMDVSLNLDAVLLDGSASILDGPDAEALYPKQALLTTSGRVECDTGQRLLFTPSNGNAPMADGACIRLKFDLSLQIINRSARCCLMPIKISCQRKYNLYHVHGLLLRSVNDDTSATAKFWRIGMFEWRGSPTCNTAQHEECDHKTHIPSLEALEHTPFMNSSRQKIELY